MLTPYLRKADTTNMLLPYFRDSDTTSLNLSSRFNTKLNISDTLNMLSKYLRKADTTSMLTNYLRTGVAASTYLTQSNAASTYLPLTGGTLSGNLRLSSSNATQLNIDANDNNMESRITFSTIGNARSKIYTTSSVSSMTFESIAQASARRGFRFISSSEGTQYLGLVQDPQGNVGIKSDATGNDLHPNTLYVNGTLGVTGAITEGGNNVMTNLDTVSLSSRIDNKVGLTGNETVAGNKTLSGNTTLSGTVTTSNLTGTANAVVGKTSSNVLTTVTSVNQTGFMYNGSETLKKTDANGNITINHGLSWTPTAIYISFNYQT
ncbi:MAG: hypothetical protein EBS18_05065, partial [Actinobacteria bacterium]|nr:hypothetical protein [Actinomycetota bacterium]